MSDDLCSISSSEIPEADDEYPIQDIPYRFRRIPLHPILACRERVLLTEENQYTFKQTAKRCRQSVEAWGPSIAYVHDEFITYELCKLAIKSTEHSIGCINPRLLKQEEYYQLCLAAAKENGWTMRDIPQHVQTQALCDAGIRSICWAIQFCREEFKTYDNCLSAVSRNGATIEHVPRKFIDKQMCWAAVQARYVCLNLIPKEFLTQDLCIQAVESHGENIRYVPDEFMSSELAMIAIQSPGETAPSNMAGAHIQYIPAKYLTKEIIVESAIRWYPTFKCVPKECLNDDIKQAVLEVAPICRQYME